MRLSGGTFSIDALAGFCRLHLSWQSFGASYVHSGGGGFRNITGTSPGDQPEIAYKQMFNTPHLGLGASAAFGERWTVSAEATGCLWGWETDRDIHHNRNLVVTETFKRVSMVGFDAAVAYRLTPTVAVAARVDYERYLGAKAPTQVIDTAAGTLTTYTGDAAGTDRTNVMVSGGLNVTLP